ncbi:MAG: pilus assembly protein N-terminal domain-containing protein [Myxococcales bacterium]|nr:pilus assembly protein N-terminal domain-containing protein [Myxococcales bacterium]
MRSHTALPTLTLLILISGFLDALSAPHAFAQVQIKPDKEIHLNINEEMYLPGRRVQSVSIGNSSIAQVKISSSPHAVIIGGLSPGSTTLTLIKTGGSRTVYRIVVHGIDLQKLVTEIETMTQGIEGVVVQALDRDRVRIDGSVYSQRDLTRVQRITEFYAPNVLNLVELDPLYVKSAKMIEVVFNFAEVRKNNDGNWGINWANGQIGGDASADGLIIRQNSAPTTTNSLELRFQGIFPVAINYLTARGHATIYDTHRVLVGDSQEAIYEAGGQLNVVAAGLNAGELRAIPFGTLLKVRPRIGRTGTLELNINGEVSALDNSNIVSGIPALLTNRVQTSVIVKLGQTVAISGLVRREDANAINGIIGLNRIPILGYFFRSDNFRNRRTDAVLFVTPRVVEYGSSHHKQQVDRVLSRVLRYQDE